MVKSEDGEPEYLRKLFIGGLDYKTTNESLKKHFEQWGDIVDVVVMRDPHTRKSRGFGFITYSQSNMVDDAQLARPHKVDGRVVETKRAVPRSDSGKPEANVTVKKLFVNGIKEEMDEDEIKGYFLAFGNVKSVTIVVDRETRKRRGFAFVEFDDYDPVDKIYLFSDHQIGGKRIEVKKALSREEMAALGGPGGLGRGGMGGKGGMVGRGGQFGGGMDGGWGGRDGNWGGRDGNWGGRDGNWAGRDGNWADDGYGDVAGRGRWGGRDGNWADDGFGDVAGGGRWGGRDGNWADDGFGDVAGGGRWGGADMWDEPRGGSWRGGSDYGGEGNWRGGDGYGGYQQDYGGGPMRGGGGYGGSGRPGPYSSDRYRGYGSGGGYAGGSLRY